MTRAPEQAPVVLERTLAELGHETGRTLHDLLAATLERPTRGNRRAALWALAAAWPDVPLHAGFVIHLALTDPGLTPWRSWDLLGELVALLAEHGRYVGLEGLSELERWERDQLAAEADARVEQLCGGTQPARTGDWTRAEA